jgi:hypothetical protein
MVATARRIETHDSALPIRFAHLAEHRMPDGRILIDRHPCSRYNRIPAG